MRSAVSKILAGEFNKDVHFLDISIPRIEIAVHSGEQYEGSFIISGPEGSLTEGNIYSDSLRMKCLTNHFVGAKEEIGFVFDSSELDPGEMIQGELTIVSSQGEYTIPYQVQIKEIQIDSSLGTIKNLFHFTNLARSNYEEAVNLFYSPEFLQIFQGADKQFESLYRGLSGGEKRAQNVEEFLLQIKKKQSLQFVTEIPEIKLENPAQGKEYKVTIRQNGWGYSDLSIDVDGEFLVIETNHLKDEDFSSGSYTLPFYLSDEKLHAGKNYGKIRFYNAYTELEVIVLVTISSDNILAVGKHRQEKHLVFELMQFYEAFRTKKMKASSWMQETERIINSLRELNEEKIEYQLFQAQLFITQERFSEAQWILDQADQVLQKDFEPERYCYALYLRTLLNREEEFIDEMALRVERIFAQNPESWRIAWLLLYLSEEYGKSPSRRWMMLEEQFRQGCFSPVLYVEAYHLMISNRTLLSELSPFEVQVLFYAWKKDLLNENIAEQIVFLSFKGKNYSDKIYQLLTKCYELLPGDEALKAICTLLIKGGKTGSEAHKWYELGIQKELRITRLYEFYMMSCELSDQVEIPKVVLMYFAFDSSLDALHNAFLYAYVYKNKEKYPELFISYKEQIERFVVFQILKERNNEWLSYLYKNVLTESMITEETAKGLSTCAFIQRLQIFRSDIRKVVILYEKQREEVLFEINSKEVYLPIYGSDFVLVLEDGKGCRYSNPKDYRLERLMIPDKFVTLLMPYIRDNQSFMLFLCERGKSLAAINEGNISVMHTVLQMNLLLEQYQQELLMNLMHYYFDHNELTKLDEFLEGLSLEHLLPINRAEVIQMMIVRGMYEKAYEFICHSHGTVLDAKNLMRLCSRLIDMGQNTKDEMMLTLVHQAFVSGKYDDNLLQYLNAYYEGTVKSMRDIFKAIRAFNMDAFAIAERILVQLLYTGAYLSETEQIFRYYVSEGADTDIELAFLSQHCFDFFVYDKVSDGQFVKEIQRVMDRGDEIPFIIKLAYTKYYAENKDQIKEENTEYLTTYLRDLLNEKLYFPYFKEYADHLSFMRQFADKTMIQYRLEVGKMAMIHYLSDQNDGEYTVEEMPEMYGGLLVKEFVLFFGEKIQYYITESNGESEHLTESGTLCRSDTDREQKESKYSLINDIATSRTLSDENTMDSFLNDYYQKEFIVKNLFSIR